MFRSEVFALFLIMEALLCSGSVFSSEDFEPYRVRPKIEAVAPIAHPELGSMWEKLKQAQLEMIAQTMEMYPDREVYFFARDMEYGYDLWRKLNSRNEKERDRAHLVNVSQDSKHAEHLERYLSSQGLSRSKIISGQKFLLVDTGYYGSILSSIKEVYSAAAPHQIATQLGSSGNADFPSSRSFLVHLDERAADVSPKQLHEVIKRYESLPHFTEKAQHYEEFGGHWEPMGAPADEYQREEALKHMEDLAHFAEDPRTHAHFEARRSFWREMKRLELKGNRGETIHHLKELLAKNPKDAMTRAAVRDFLEITHLNPDSEFPMGLRVTDVALAPEAGSFSGCLPHELEQDLKKLITVH